MLPFPSHLSEAPPPPQGLPAFLLAAGSGSHDDDDDSQWCSSDPHVEPRKKHVSKKKPNNSTAVLGTCRDASESDDNDNHHDDAKKNCAAAETYSHHHAHYQQQQVRQTTTKPMARYYQDRARHAWTSRQLSPFSQRQHSQRQGRPWSLPGFTAIPFMAAYGQVVRAWHEVAQAVNREFAADGKTLLFFPALSGTAVKERFGAYMKYAAAAGMDKTTTVERSRSDDKEPVNDIQQGIEKLYKMYMAKGQVKQQLPLASSRKNQGTNAAGEMRCQSLGQMTTVENDNSHRKKNGIAN